MQRVELEPARSAISLRDVARLAAEQPLDGTQREPLLLDGLPELLDRHPVVVSSSSSSPPRLAGAVVRQIVEQALGFPVHGA
jgi:hypothetical protein